MCHPGVSGRKADERRDPSVRADPGAPGARAAGSPGGCPPWRGVLRLLCKRRQRCLPRRPPGLPGSCRGPALTENADLMGPPRPAVRGRERPWVPASWGGEGAGEAQPSVLSEAAPGETHKSCFKIERIVPGARRSSPLNTSPLS